MEEKLQQLKNILGQVADLNQVAGLLGWDQQTYMPPGAAEGRGYQMSTLRTIAHIKFTSDEVGQLLEDLQAYAGQLDPDSHDARLIRVTQREYTKSTRVPPSMVAEFSRTAAVAHNVWEAARAESNFEHFRPHLEHLVELRRQYADLFAPYEHVYDPLLDDFEPGLKTADVQAIFAVLRPQQVALIQAIAARPPIDDSVLRQDYDAQKQWDFNVAAATQIGYDWRYGRLDKAVHPFTQSIGIDDVRLTTRVLTDYIGSALFGTLHEAGHGLYERGIDPALARTPLATGASLAVHESQSRMWENLVGRSLPFWEHFYPRLQAVFPAQLGGARLEHFYRAINKVEPSLIRVEADEATYNMHIMLRLELEIAMMDGSLEVKDLPEAWNARMRDYLGITPPNDKEGVLQDVHWSSGMMGYFSTYALGNLISVQLWECINRDIPDLAQQFRKGEFSGLLEWLHSRVHRHGAKFEPQELVRRVTGSPIDPAPYMRYLQTKYGEIYGL